MHPLRPLATFAYALHPLRRPLRRWRWELWHRDALQSAGWCESREQAEQALCTAASRRGHSLLGVRALRPHRSTPATRLPVDGPVDVDCGAFRLSLVPRLPGAAGWALTAAASG